MSCSKTYKKTMASVRNRYPNYSLKRRKKITRARIYYKRKWLENYLIRNKMKIKPIKVGTINQTVHGLGTPEDLAEFKEWQQLDFHAQLKL